MNENQETFFTLIFSVFFYDLLLVYSIAPYFFSKIGKQKGFLTLFFIYGYFLHSRSTPNLCVCISEKKQSEP